MDAELKAHMEMLVREVNRLSGVVSNQSTLINDINIKATTRVAELQKDVDDLFETIKTVESRVREVDESQKFKWRALNEQRDAAQKERDTERKEFEEFRRDQSVQNEANRNVRIILWAIFTMVLGLVATLVWALIVNGGVRNLFVP